jgi:hypothetical protein
MFKLLFILLLAFTTYPVSNALIGGAVGYALGSSDAKANQVNNGVAQVAGDSTTSGCIITLDACCCGRTYYDFTCGKVCRTVVDVHNEFLPDEVHQEWLTLEEYLILIFPRKQIVSYQLIKDDAKFQVTVVVRIRNHK